MAITVSIVEDQEQLRNTLSRVLSRADDFECVSTYGSAEEAIETSQKLAAAGLLTTVDA